MTRKTSYDSWMTIIGWAARLALIPLIGWGGYLTLRVEAQAGDIARIESEKKLQYDFIQASLSRIEGEVLALRADIKGKADK